MDREIKFLRFLLRKNADTTYINVDRKLKDIGLASDIQTHDFLGSLKKKGYIDWINKRPTTRDSMGGFVAVPNTVDILLAKITITGKEYLRENTLKNRASNTALYSFLVAAFALLFSVIQWLSSTKKEEKYERELGIIHLRLDSISRKMSVKIVEPRRVIVDKDSTIKAISK